MTRWTRWTGMALWIGLAVMLAWGCLLSGVAQAASARELDVRVEETLARFREEVSGSEQVIQKAKGILVMPKVYKAGIGIGGEYGEGALLMQGRTVDYYNMIAGSFGFQLGGQRKSILLFFMEDSALQTFRQSEGWKVGADASVALIHLGAAGSLDSTTLNKPIIAFVIGQRGLMYDLSLEGAKFNKLHKK